MKLNKKLVFLALIIAVFLDAVDFAVFGLIPIVGDVLDIAGIIVLWILGLGPWSLIGIAELIPIIGDFLPSFVTATVLGLILGGHRK